MAEFTEPKEQCIIDFVESVFLTNECMVYSYCTASQSIVYLKCRLLLSNAKMLAD